MEQITIIVARFPGVASLEELAAHRDYVLESLASGCLALGSGMNFSVEQVPAQLCGVVVGAAGLPPLSLGGAQAGDVAPGPAPTETPAAGKPPRKRDVPPSGAESPPKPGPKKSAQTTPPAPPVETLREHDIPGARQLGRNAGEKAAILERLRVYRKMNGLGCLEAVAKYAGSDVSADMLRNLLLGGSSLPIEAWRRIGKALEMLERETRKGEPVGG